jgi:hypothetical protein
MRKLIFLALLFSQMLSLSACGHSTISVSKTTPAASTQTQSNSSTQQTPTPSASQSSQSNIDESADPSSAEIIKHFYQYLNEQNYKSAVSLLGPQLQFEGDPNTIKYLKNIKKTNFIKLEDISNNSGPIDPNYSQYYKIKVYYAEINFEVQDPNLVKGLEGVNYRRFILIKKTEQSSWLIDTDEDTPERKPN